MAREITIAREASTKPLNATGGTKGVRVSEKVIGGIRNALNQDDSHDKFTEDITYSRGVVTAYTTEKGYGDRPSYVSEYSSAPTLLALGRGFTSRDAYAASVFNEFSKKGIKIKKLVHHGQYD